jgi:uncharacterized repeat protein (TIGR03803 family)
MFCSTFSELWRGIVINGVVLVFLLLASAIMTTAQAPLTYQETILHSFANTPDGEYPGAGLLMGDKGVFYGTTEGGGTLQGGTVFLLDKSRKEAVLYNFPSIPGEPNPMPMGDLVMDAQANLYGSTWEGGSAFAGTVFKVTPDGQETDLHVFTGQGGDGYLSKAGVVIDKKGNLYGTTIEGGAYGNGQAGFGTVYRVDASGNEAVVYSFSGKEDGGLPFASLVLDAKGNFYGTTYEGGDLSCNPPYGCGTVFKVDKAGKETVLYSFTGAYPDYGTSPVGGVVRDSHGNLYGTTAYGGTASYRGNVFKLTPSGKITNLHSFTETNGDGEWPSSNLTLDRRGNIYGATNFGGDPGCNLGCGVVFKVSPSGKETVLFTFKATNTGYEPTELVRDECGDLYGTTIAGGAYGVGTIFKLSPR